MKLKQTLFFNLLLVAVLLGSTACNSAKSNNGKAMLKDKYHKLGKTDKLSDFEGRKISFEGTLSTMIMQHMMKGSPMPFGDDDAEAEEHKYLSPTEDLYSFGEMVGYYYPSKVKWPTAKKLVFYGTINSISGAGKGGGTHTEYYIDLDKVEAAN